MEAMRKKQAELDAQAAKKTVKDDKAEAARLAKAKKEAEESARKAQATAAKEQPKAKKPAVAPVAAVASPAPRAQAVSTAAVGLSADQVVGSSSLSRREKLDALLGLYLADTISPREYHQHRAAIVAQP